ncbi:MAG: hypothetical protein WBQ25_11810, partial [Nitrososphaeraceae archaeon]
AMTRLGIKIISAGAWDYDIKSGNSQYHIFSVNDVGKDNSSKDNINQVIHIPINTGFEAFEGGPPIKLPLQQILNDTNQHILKFGYSVIVMHPTSFLIMKNGTYTKTVDEKEINNLKNLIESIKSKNIHTTSLSKLAAINSLKVTPAPAGTSTTPVVNGTTPVVNGTTIGNPPRPIIIGRSNLIASPITNEKAT